MGNVLVNLSQEENLGLRHGEFLKMKYYMWLREEARRQWFSIRGIMSG